MCRCLPALCARLPPDDREPHEHHKTIEGFVADAAAAAAPPVPAAVAESV
jgi:hypothetical protein